MRRLVSRKLKQRASVLTKGYESKSLITVGTVRYPAESTITVYRKLKKLWLSVPRHRRNIKKIKYMSILG